MQTALLSALHVVYFDLVDALWADVNRHYFPLNEYRPRPNQINLRLFDVKRYHDCHRCKSGLQNTDDWCNV